MPPRKKVRIANPLTAKELAALLEVSVTEARMEKLLEPSLRRLAKS